MPENDKNTNGLLGKLWDTISIFFEAAFGKVWTGFTTIWFTILGKTAGIIVDWWESIGDGMWEKQTKIYIARGWIDKDTKSDFDSLKDVPTPFNLVAYLIVTVSMLTGIVKNMMYVAGADLRRKLFSKYKPEDVSPRELLPTTLLAPETTAEIREIIRNQGIDDHQIDLLFMSMRRAYDENTVRELYHRGIIDDAKLLVRMRELGYTDKRTAEIVQSWPVIPGPGDLFHLVAKEAFEPDIIAHYGYDEEFPVDQLKWLKAQGISEDWARKYWYAHWETPSIGQGFEMLHRGVIDFDELNDLFRTVEIPPFWRARLTEVAFNPFTRVDVRRMHKLGTLSDDELLWAYMDAGYDEDKATKMMEFTIAYNAEDEIKLTKSQILSGFTEYILTHEEALELLQLLKFSEDEAEFLISLEEYDRDKKLQTEQIKSTEKRLLLSLITDTAARDKLNTLNLPAKKIEVLLDSWQLEKYDKLKVPTKAELARFMKSEIIDETIYRAEMGKLNYDTRRINWYLQEIHKMTRKEVYNGS